MSHDKALYKSTDTLLYMLLDNLGYDNSRICQQVD